MSATPGARARLVKKPGPGRAPEDRPDPISLYALAEGTWTCKCGHTNKILTEVCVAKISKGPCGRSRPNVRIGMVIPANIAMRFLAKCHEKGLNTTSSVIVALGEWAGKT